MGRWPGERLPSANSASPASATPSDPPSTPATPRSAPESALADAVREIEHHVAAAGWDAPVRVFALVRTQAALEASPAWPSSSTRRCSPRHACSRGT
ncbi:hypothetical protein [Cellulomonas soli]